MDFLKMIFWRIHRDGFQSLSLNLWSSHPKLSPPYLNDVVRSAPLWVSPFYTLVAGFLHLYDTFPEYVSQGPLFPEHPRDHGRQPGDQRSTSLVPLFLVILGWPDRMASPQRSDYECDCPALPFVPHFKRLPLKPNFPTAPPWMNGLELRL